MSVPVDIDKVPGSALRKAVSRVISDPSRVWRSASGKRMQILSPGRLNSDSGPDLRDTAVLMSGIVIVGDCEFHRSLSDRDLHHHTLDPAFNRVILQIVINDGLNKKCEHEILVVPEEEIVAELKLLDVSPAMEPTPAPDMSLIEDLQHCALKRLLSNAATARKLLNNMSVRQSLNFSISDFIRRYSTKKRRPVYSNIQLKGIIDALPESGLYYFLSNLKQGKFKDTGNELMNLMDCRIPGLGINLGKEIVHNCILPIALCLAKEQSRIELFEWYWSSKALNVYGILSRSFPEVPQDYVWQQQGMLEYLRKYGCRIRKDIPGKANEYNRLAAYGKLYPERPFSYSRARSRQKRYSQ